MNRSMLTGRLTKDIELKKTAGNKSVINFNLAIERTFRNTHGERQTDFISCVAWNSIAEIMANNELKKGAWVGIDGRLQTREYQEEDGSIKLLTEVVVTEIQLFNGIKQYVNKNGSSENLDKFKQEAKNLFSDDGPDIYNDELPF